MSISNRLESAAAKLEGLTLDKGWKVRRLLPVNPNATGGTFSHSYLVENDGKKGFLKAFDFSEALDPAVDTIEFLRILTSAYEHERDILYVCRDRRMSKVVIALDHGSVQLPGTTNLDGQVFYLIFEMANGDIRGQVDETKRFDAL